LPGYIQDNDLEIGQRRFVLIDMGLAIGLGAIVAGALFVWKRGAGLEILERLTRRASPLALAWLALLVFDRRLWDGQDLLVLPLVVGLGWGLVVTLRTSWATEPAFPGLDRVRANLSERWRDLSAARLARPLAVLRKPSAPLVVVVLCAAAYAIYFSLFTIVSHDSLGTHAFDLGLEDNLMWHVVHGGLPLFRSTPFTGPSTEATHFGNHATWFSYVLAPVYAIAPRPETLLVIQAILIAAAAIPLYLYAGLHLPRWTAAIVACAYLVYPPLHGANLYDFHYLPLGVVFLWMTLYAVETNRRALAIGSVVLALSVREDVAACLAVVGLYLLLAGVAARAGAIIACIGAGYFLLMTLLIMPTFGHVDASLINQYARLVPKDDSGFVGVVKTLLSNPVFTLNVVLERGKLTYLLELLTPVLFLPWTRPIGLLFMVPGLVFTLLSTDYWPLYQPSFQYTTYWTVFVFIGVVVALEHAGRARHAGDVGALVRRRTLVAGFVVASLAGTYLDGAILSRENVRSGFNHAHFTTTPEEGETSSVPRGSSDPQPEAVPLRDTFPPRVETGRQRYRTALVDSRQLGAGEHRLVDRIQARGVRDAGVFVSAIDGVSLGQRDAGSQAATQKCHPVEWPGRGRALGHGPEFQAAHAPVIVGEMNQEMVEQELAR
jgi:uncharacterized membrane protein